MGSILKFNIDMVRKIATERGGKLLSDTYENARIPLEWECNKGHRWKTSLMAVRNNGSWCPHCAGKAKKTIEFCQRIALEKGGKCLSNTYKNNKTKLKWKCKLSHIWWANLDKIQIGQWCPICAIRKNADDKRDSISDLQKIAEIRGGKLISEIYQSAHAHLEWECALGHRWKAKSTNIKTGTWCPQCKGYRGERLCRAYMEHLLQTPFPKSYPMWLQISKSVKLELDGYSTKLGIAFEHQGEQHYVIHRHFGKTLRSLSKQKKYDKIKREKCLENDVVLIEIPALGSKLKLSELESFLRTQLKRNGIAVLRQSPVSIEWENIYTPEDKERFQRLQKIAALHGGKLLTTEYLGQKEKHLWECKSGHRWEAIPESIDRGGTWCAICSKKAKRTIEELISAAEKNRGRLLNRTYRGTKYSYRWECEAGHKFKNSGENILKGQWCGRCHRAKPNVARMSPVICSNGERFESVKATAERFNMAPGSIVRLLRSGRKTKTGLSFTYMNRHGEKH